MRNRNDYPIKVTAVGFDMQAGTTNRAARYEPPPRATIPRVIPPRDLASADVVDKRLSPLDLRQPLVGWAELATGERFYSKSSTLRR